MPVTIQETRQQGKEFAAKHIVELAVELNTWQDTSLLPHGRLRELGEILKSLDERDYLRIAESFVERACRDHIISTSKK